MKDKGDLFKPLAIVCSMVVFCLVLLPLLLVSTFPHSDQGMVLPPVKKGAVVPVPEYINVYRHATGKTEAIPFEDYVKGVVSGEMPASFEMEALKAQAVAARTYSLSKVIRSGNSGNPDHPSAPVCDDTHCQVYRSPEELSQLKSAEWMKTGWPKIQEAVDSTKGQLMYYQGQLVEQPLFFSASGGENGKFRGRFRLCGPVSPKRRQSLRDGRAPPERAGRNRAQRVQTENQTDLPEKKSRQCKR